MWKLLTAGSLTLSHRISHKRTEEEGDKAGRVDEGKRVMTPKETASDHLRGIQLPLEKKI
jgi:hypothetical protein